MVPQKKPPIISDQIINKAIPDNIDLFMSWLNDQDIKYYDFLRSNDNFKQKKIKLFIKKYPKVLQLKLF